MCIELSEAGQQLDSSTSIDIIQGLYDNLELLSLHRRLAGQVTYPIKSSKFLEDIDGSAETLLKFNFYEEGGKFIGDPSIRQDLCGVLKCLGNFVKFGDGSKKYTDFDSELYRILPEIFIDIANKSRIDSGYRLLMRCVRHVIDCKSHDIKHAKFVKDDNGKIVFILENHVPASMRNNIYHSQCAIDEDGVLVSCKCNCQSGAEGIERVTCVHILPFAYQFSIFMVAYLAENILLELSALVNSNMIEESLPKNDRESLIKDIGLLIDTASEVDEISVVKGNSIRDMLQCFSVGTEKRKSHPVGVVPADQLGPLRLIKKKSIIKKAANKVKKNVDVDCEQNICVDSNRYYCNGKFQYWI